MVGSTLAVELFVLTKTVSEELWGLVVVDAERENKVVVERRLSTFRTMTCDGTAYTSKVA